MSGKRGPTKTTQADASRIQSAQARNGQDTGKGAFSARVQSAAAKNANAAAAAPKPPSKAAPATPTSPKK
ncbi:hypothetical protein FA95DRAFT_1555142 [Auriscalpium vulgare]|uniref:Uncharacterized protein n=1 Tax=Auriscalpium vulgare TaxID=40419 RepID=A0ACB8S320_9AGAM|nr:hypothetical protein FA95DRAFT_1555142 [Auriscalpium vulgare]